MAFLTAAAKEALAMCNCNVVLKSFSPQQLPALYVPGADCIFDGEMSSEGFSSFFEGFSFDDEEEDDYSAKLYLNCNNPLIKRLAKSQDTELVKTIVQVIYVQAFMAGHYTMGEQEMEIMNSSLTKLMGYGLDGGLV